MHACIPDGRCRTGGVAPAVPGSWHIAPAADALGIRSVYQLAGNVQMSHVHSLMGSVFVICPPGPLGRRTKEVGLGDRCAADIDALAGTCSAAVRCPILVLFLDRFFSCNR